jgi:hypothetical protein
MSALKDLLDRIGSGEIDVHDALPEFRDLLRRSDPDRPPGDLTYKQKERRALEDDHGDYRGTFSEVTAAWISGNLTDAQYQTLREAVAPIPIAQNANDLGDLSDIHPPDGWEE